MTEKFQSDYLSLNLQENHQGILERRGRNQGVYPVYLPDKELFSEKLVAHAHKTALHGGVGLTMVKVRERYWVNLEPRSPTARWKEDLLKVRS